jgi:uroporphyrinogen decarboxylase
MSMTSMERVLTTLGHKEPDRVPLFILSTMHYAKENKIPLKEYFSKAENVVEGELHMLKKYGHDCLYPFFYGPIVIEAWGGDVIFRDDGPPNSGSPIIKKPKDIKTINVPSIANSQKLQEVLKAIKLLKTQVKDEVPIFGVSISPFSLPVMQMGFSSYLDLIFEHRDLFHTLMEKNEEFCTNWSNAQLEAGATGIVYFDPISSPMMVDQKMFKELSFPIMKRAMQNVNGPVATHFASGTSLPIIDQIISCGTVGVGISSEEDLSKIKSKCKNKISVIGNLNGIEMRRWTPKDAEQKVKEAIAQGGKGGGFILSDNHGEIPFQVPDEILLAISHAVKKWGKYPLEWIDDEKR